MATTSKEGSRRVNYPILTQGGSDNNSNVFVRPTILSGSNTPLWVWRTPNWRGLASKSFFLEILYMYMVREWCWNVYFGHYQYDNFKI